MIHPLAGKPADKESLISLADLESAYYDLKPNPKEVAERISFGTSGHRGKSLERSFNELHVAAIAQAICDGRETFGAEGICFVGSDTHALSKVAERTVREVLAGNGVIVACDSERGYVPTPSLSRAILRYNEKRKTDLADGIVLTPSHNPPEYGGIKYNPTHGGPAGETVTAWIEERANAYVKAGGEGIKRIPLERISGENCIAYDFKGLYVKELIEIIDIELLKDKKLHVLIDALGGSGGSYWEAIRDTYGLDLTIIHSEADPTFSFMHYDYDGAIRMDCSSSYAMAGVVASIGEYDLAGGNDPDYDRFGIVTKSGLMQANEFLAVAMDYLFSTRNWQGKGVGKTVVVTELINRLAKDKGIEIFEVPVGFKYFSSLLFEGKAGLVGEESAGAGFLKKDGTVWTTDKDGIIMVLLGMEIMAATGKSPSVYYEELASVYGKPYGIRYEAPCSLAEKKVLKALDPGSIQATDIMGDPITEVRRTSLFGSYEIGGLRITTKNGWLVARPSGTEDLYKVYGETFLGEDMLVKFVEEGKRIVSSALKEGVK